MFGTAILLILAMTMVAYFVGRSAGRRFVRDNGGRHVHSLPNYHGMFVAVWVGIPSFVFVLLWTFASGPTIDTLLVASLPASLTEEATEAQIGLYLTDIKNLAAGVQFGTPAPEIFDAADTLNRWNRIADWGMVAVALAMSIAALAITRSRLTPRFRARNNFERVLSGIIIACSVAAILTTAGIVISLVIEAARFFQFVPVTEFLFGTRWEPQIAIRPDQVAGQGAFGALPVFSGTLLIATIAMLFATPIGLFTAIYLVEYASGRVRSTVKPILEILAGVPTIVYGVFAITIISPLIRDAGDAMGLVVSAKNALSAGLVMGVMLIPFISSISDDAIRSVPRSLRDGSLAMGATRAETMTRVLLPAALPGIMGGVLLAVSRAIGETMIVVLAAGLIARLTINPLSDVTTVTAQIVSLLVGDTEFDSPKTLAAFALGLTLFIVTLGLNVVALRIVNRFREKYD